VVLSNRLGERGEGPAVAGTSAGRSVVRLTAYTIAPLSARTSAQARPIPFHPPVTTATAPSGPGIRNAETLTGERDVGGAGGRPAPVILSIYGGSHGTNGGRAMKESTATEHPGKERGWRPDVIDLSRPLTLETVYALFGDLVADEDSYFRQIRISTAMDFTTANATSCYLSIPDHVGLP
jgi:hypothetical protein